MRNVSRCPLRSPEEKHRVVCTSALALCLTAETWRCLCSVQHDAGARADEPGARGALFALPGDGHQGHERLLRHGERDVHDDESLLSLQYGT